MGSSPSSISAAAETSFQVPLILEVLQGRTQFRDRPVTSSRFLIGSGPACDLRLGGSEIPPVHSLIVVEHEGIVIEAMAPAPALIHNGRPTTSATLQDGDSIRIGALEFRAHVTGRMPQLSEPASAPIPLTIAQGTAEQPAGEIQSAADLVDLIERDQSAIEEFETRQSQGAAALLHAARAFRRKPPRRERLDQPEGPPAPHFHVGIPEIATTVAAGPSAEKQLTDELEEIGKTLHLLSQEMQNRSQRSTERELSLAQTISQLLDAQQRLVTQLEVVTRQVQTLQARENGTREQSRAIA